MAGKSKYTPRKRREAARQRVRGFYSPTDEQVKQGGETMARMFYDNEKIRAEQLSGRPGKVVAQ